MRERVKQRPRKVRARPGEQGHALEGGRAFGGELTALGPSDLERLCACWVN